MVGMVFVVLFGFGGVVWWSSRAAKRRVEKGGEVFAPPGKLRWTDSELPR